MPPSMSQVIADVLESEGGGPNRQLKESEFMPPSMRQVIADVLESDSIDPNR